MTRPLALLTILYFCACATPSHHVVDQKASPLGRHYKDGEKLRYSISQRTIADGKTTRGYKGHADVEILKDQAGSHFESFHWLKISIKGKQVRIPPSYRQLLTLDRSLGSIMKVPPPEMINGATSDTLNFYVNELTAIKQTNLQRPGDHFRIPFMSKPVSFADHKNTLLALECFDFDIELVSIQNDRAEVRVSNIPPRDGCHQEPPAPWMRERVGESENNRFMIERSGENTYNASAGTIAIETILQIDLKDGKIHSASMRNPARYRSRKCSDEAATRCNAPDPERSFVREVEFKLENGH